MIGAHSEKSAGILAVAAFALLGIGAGSAAAHDCRCRANGAVYAQGQLACIRGKLARCAMALNNSSWKIVADVCPQARLIPRKLPHSDKPGGAAEVRT